MILLKKLPFSFYIKYCLNRRKYLRGKKEIVVLLCAASVAFCSMSIGFLGEFSAQVNNRIKNISDRLLVLINDSTGEGAKSSFLGVPFEGLTMNLPVTERETEEIQAINGVESVEPVIVFPSFSTNVTAFSPSDNGLDEEKITEAETCNILFSNADGLSERRTVKMSEPERLKPGDLTGVFYALSYPSQTYVEGRCETLDQTVSKGVYISEGFAKQLGILPKHLNGLRMSVDFLVPICRLKAYEFYDNVKVKTYDDFYSKMTIEFSIRGIFTSSNPLYAFYISPDFMTEMIKTAATQKMNEAKSYLKAYNEIFGDSYGKAEIMEWALNTYYITVESVQDIKSIYNEATKINPNFVVAYERQNIEANIQMVHNNRNIMLYISFSVLAIVLLLTALIYVNLIDKRKFEFAVLRANGMTKKEIRSIIYTEMLFEFIKTFITGFLFTILIDLIAYVWLEYPFRCNEMTVLWLFIISIGFMMLPTVISLFSVNKYEPDRVMRN